MKKEYKLIHSTKSVLFNNELGIAQANGWIALPETLKSELDFFSVLVERVVNAAPDLRQQSLDDAWAERQGMVAPPTLPNSSEYHSDCGCHWCK